MPNVCWENNWSAAKCRLPAIVRMEDATGSGAPDVWLCEPHAQDYEEQGAPWRRATENT